VPWAPLLRLLYYGPSLLPVLWIQAIRFFPAAVAVLWPGVRQLPRDLLDAAEVDRATAWQQFRLVIVPLNATAWARAGLAVGVLSLGELSASKLVSTPGAPTFAHEVFAQMHYGVGNDVAALCLLLLAIVLVGAVLVVGLDALLRAAGRVVTTLHPPAAARPQPPSPHYAPPPR
jgi:ABC-type Fe3+ transport system permease subunit